MKNLLCFLLFVCSTAYSQNTAVQSTQSDNQLTDVPLKVGEVLPSAISTIHPYNDEGVAGLVFEKAFYSKNSAYIKLHFSNFDLGPDDYVEITAVNSGESIIYAAKGKIIDQNMTMLSDFWSQVLFDEHIVVRLYSQQASDYYGFDIVEVAYGYAQHIIDQILADAHPEKAICGGDEKEPVICYSGTNMYNKGKAVCRLLIGGGSLCTGWLLGCEGHLMTNNHCIGTASSAANTDFMFNYQHTNCNGSGSAVTDIVATSATFIKTSANLDYTLVKLPVNPTSTYGYLSLSSVAPVVGDRIYIVGHPGGRKKEITVVTDNGGDVNGNAMVNLVNTNGIRYYADTEGGSSGSPVLNYNSNLVVAIHNTGGCMNGSDGRSDKLIAHIGNDIPACGIDNGGGVIITPPDDSCSVSVSTFPYSESFENTTGGWSQSASDDFNWSLNNGSTPSSNTGPSLADDGNYYIYMESSSPNYSAKTASLNSPCFDLSAATNLQLSFRYHLYGAAAMGNLKLEATTDGNSWTEIWSKSGNQGDSWQSASLSLAAYSGETSLQLRFKGTTGTTWQGDMAIDAFEISSGGGTPGGGCSNAISTFPYTESFENTTAAWSQGGGDDFDWSVNSGSTPSSNTGPSSADNGSYYIYMEYSTPNYSTKNAKLISPCFDLSASPDLQLSFRYHMYGAAAMGNLKLEASTDGNTWTEIWARSGNQGNSWQTASVSLAAYSNTASLQLRFNGTTGTTWQGDMAVDAFTISEGSTGGCDDVVLTLNFDNYPEETSWQINNNSGTTVASGGTYANQADGSTLQITECLNPGCYTLLIYDSYGDGMCCAYGSGSYTLENSVSGIVLVSGGSFNSSSSTSFCVGNEMESLSEHFDLIAEDVGTFLEVSPNPFSDYIEISSNINADFKYIITNVHGQTLETGLVENKMIRPENLNPGFYFLTLYDSKKQIIRKLVKK